MEIDTASVWDLVPFARRLGVRFDELTPSRVRAVLPWSTEHATIGGGLHGGAVMGLADVGAAVAAVLSSGDPRSAPATIQSSTSFLRPLVGDAVATTAVLSSSRTTVVVRVEVRDGAGALCADVVQTVVLRRPTGGASEGTPAAPSPARP